MARDKQNFTILDERETYCNDVLLQEMYRAEQWRRLQMLIYHIANTFEQFSTVGPAYVEMNWCYSNERNFCCNQIIYYFVSLSLSLSLSNSQKYSKRKFIENL